MNIIKYKAVKRTLLFFNFTVDVQYIFIIILSQDYYIFTALTLERGGKF